jgi:hypothetical protein
VSDFPGDVTRPPGPWAENVDPALAALWDSGVIAPLETAADALRAADHAEDRRPPFDSALERVATARDSLLAAADAIDDDERLRAELVSLAGTLTDVSAELLGFFDQPDMTREAIRARREQLEDARVRLERVLG